MEQRDHEHAPHKDEVHEMIAAGMVSSRVGEGVDGDTFLAGIDRELAKFERREPEICNDRDP